MALVWVVVDIPATVPQADGTTGPDPSLSGEVYIQVKVIDTVAPTTIIHSQGFTFPSSMTTAQMQAAITASLSKIKAARERRVSLQPSVGTQVPLT